MLLNSKLLTVWFLVSSTAPFKKKNCDLFLLGGESCAQKQGFDRYALSFVSRCCHFDVDRDVSTAYCWSSSGNSVDRAHFTICSTVAVCDRCI